MSDIHRPNRGEPFDLRLAIKDLGWLKKYHPLLTADRRVDGVDEIQGNLKFAMSYNNSDNSFLIGPQAGGQSNGVYVEDEYQIKMTFTSTPSSKLPHVFEVDKKIESFAKGNLIDLPDLHVNPNGAVCLCVAGAEVEYFPSGFKLSEFINQMVIPFFYEQTFYQRYRHWPWGEYAHGVLGIIEKYGETHSHSREKTEKVFSMVIRSEEKFTLQQMLKKRKNIKGYKKCVCGSKKKMSECHPGIYVGLSKLKDDLIKLSIPHLVVLDKDIK